MWVSRTFFIVLRALVVTFKRIFSPNIWESTRFCWTLGSQERRVLCFEKGTLFPYSFVLPWKRPSWERLKGLETTSQRVLLGNMANAEQQLVKIVPRNKHLWLFASKANAISDIRTPNRWILHTKSPLNFYFAAMESLLLLERGLDIKAYLSMRCSCTATRPTTHLLTTVFICAFVYQDQN